MSLRIKPGQVRKCLLDLNPSLSIAVSMFKLFQNIEYHFVLQFYSFVPRSAMSCKMQVLYYKVHYVPHTYIFNFGYPLISAFLTSFSKSHIIIKCWSFAHSHHVTVEWGEICNCLNQTTNLKSNFFMKFVISKSFVIFLLKPNFCLWIKIDKIWQYTQYGPIKNGLCINF